MPARSTPSVPPLFWALTPFALGIALGDRTQALAPTLGQAIAPSLPLCLLLIALAAITLARLGSPKVLGVSLLGLGLVVAGLLRNAPSGQAPPSPPWPSESQVWEGWVSEVEGPRSDGTCTARTHLAPTPRPQVIRVALDPCPRGLHPGSGLRFKGKIRPITNRHNPGERDRHPWARRLSISGVARSTMAIGLAGSDTPSPMSPLIPLRQWTAETIRHGVSSEAAGILEALILGDKSGLNDGDRAAFAESGLAHALAISGLHVAGLGLLILGLCRWLLKVLGCLSRSTQHGLSATIALLSALAYALFAGLPISALRAWLMMAIALGIRVSGRRSGALSALSLGAFVILVAFPKDLFNLGFQLSFVSVASLILVLPPLNAALDRLPWPNLPKGRWFTPPLRGLIAYGRGSILASTAASLGTAPLMALHFHGIPLAGPISNLLGLVLLGPVALPLGLSALLCHGLGLGSLGQALFFLASLSAEGALWVARLFQAGGPLPFLRVAIGPVEAALWGAIIVFGLTLLRRPIFGVIPLAGILGCVALGPREHRSTQGALTLTQLAVGQGDGLYIRFPQGETMVVDGGGLPPWGRGLWDPGKAVMLPALLMDGVTQIDHMVLTHPDPDHIGGLVALAQALPVGTLWLAPPKPGGFEERLGPGLIPASANDDLGALLQAVRHGGGEIRLALAGDRLRLGPAECVVLHPSPGFDPKGGGARKAANNGSLTWAIEAFGERLLLPGDLEAYGEGALLARGAPLSSAFLKLPHHGSDTSSTPAFLDAVAPRFAIAGVGKDNMFNFPRPSVLKALKSRGVTLCRTDRGACRLTLTEGAMTLEQWQTPRGWGPLVEPRPLWWEPDMTEPRDGPNARSLAWTKHQWKSGSAIFLRK